jgi:hypothetical protein
VPLVTKQRKPAEETMSDEDAQQLLDSVDDSTVVDALEQLLNGYKLNFAMQLFTTKIVGTLLLTVKLLLTFLDATLAKHDLDVAKPLLYWLAKVQILKQDHPSLISLLCKLLDTPAEEDKKQFLVDDLMTIFETTGLSLSLANYSALCKSCLHEGKKCLETVYKRSLSMLECPTGKGLKYCDIDSYC